MKTKKIKEKSDRPRLSNINVDAFYDKLKQASTSKEDLDFLKNVFILYTLYPSIGPATVSNRTGMSYETCQKALDTVLSIIEELESKTEKVYSPLTMIYTKEPRPYKYVDQFGKRWICLNEFFGL